MDEHTATEQAYKNGYEQGQRDAVKHGKWVKCESPWKSLYQATCCGCYFQYGDTFDYCPNCGAKMDLEVTDETD